MSLPPRRGKVRVRVNSPFPLDGGRLGWGWQHAPHHPVAGGFQTRPPPLPRALLVSRAPPVSFRAERSVAEESKALHTPEATDTASRRSHTLRHSPRPHPQASSPSPTLLPPSFRPPSRNPAAGAQLPSRPGHLRSDACTFHFFWLDEERKCCRDSQKEYNGSR